MSMQQHQPGKNGEYCVTEQVNRISHFFTIAFDHDLQLGNIFRRSLALIKAVQAVSNRQHPKNKIQTEIRHPRIVTQSINKQYCRLKQLA